MQDILRGLQQLGTFRTQTLFVEGAVENVSRQKRDAWMARIGELRPENAQIYSLDRPTASSGLKGVSRERLQGIAEETTRRTGVPVRVYG